MTAAQAPSDETTVIERPTVADPRPPSSLRRWTQRTLWSLGWLALIIGCTGVALHYTAWERREIVLAASFAPYFMVGSVIALVLLLIVRGWRSAVVACGAVIAAAATQLTLFVPDGSATFDVEIPVMQSNLLFGKANADTVVQAVRDNRIDLLTLEELTPEVMRRLEAAGLDAELPYRVVAPAGGGAGGGIYSRYPLADGVTLTGFSMSNVRATMMHPRRGPITVFQFHPMPPNLDFTAWSQELRRIRELLEATSGPAIVGADFNATFDHYAYRQLLTGRFSDAAELSGAGRLVSWPQRPGVPIIGIDRVLVADGQAEGIRSLIIPDSDHRAVIARLRL
ncbi:endonuclease/exonuclease/phosphatase family protein [Nocardia sp. NPDC050406]|uniref:endonuclease/exonuclease/phosphatase family protein n=1 Tax=Nocardia sp. NPDC050406 TaxID=3364318 RepID=UPI0037BCE07D